MKRAFLFPGQGAQTVGMGKDFYEKYEMFLIKQVVFLRSMLKNFVLKDQKKN